MNLAWFVFSCLAASAVAQSGLNILDVARRHGLYSFLFALEETNNVEALSKADHVTVFIPTNEAFQKVTAEERNKWRSDPSYYQNLLRYHVVVEGRFMKSDLVDEQRYNTSSSLWPTARFVNYTGYSYDIQTYQDAVITAYDIEASNGVIHLLDQVVSAPENQTIIKILESRPDLSNITAYVKKSTVITGWLDGSNSSQVVTFLAPNNEAMGKLSQKEQDLLNSNITVLEEILEYQILNQGTWFSRSLQDKLSVTTANSNGNRTVAATGGTISFDKAGVVTPNLAATNGVSHIVDTLVFPTPYAELSKE